MFPRKTSILWAAFVYAVVVTSAYGRENGIPADAGVHVSTQLFSKFSGVRCVCNAVAVAEFSNFISMKCPISNLRDFIKCEPAVRPIFWRKINFAFGRDDLFERVAVIPRKKIERLTNRIRAARTIYDTDKTACGRVAIVPDGERKIEPGLVCGDVSFVKIHESSLRANEGVMANLQRAVREESVSTYEYERGDPNPIVGALVPFLFALGGLCTGAYGMSRRDWLGFGLLWLAPIGGALAVACLLRLTPGAMADCNGENDHYQSERCEEYPKVRHAAWATVLLEAPAQAPA